MTITTSHFDHIHSAHCESGVMSALTHHYGFPISEAMAFGLSSALAFAFLPFIKISGMPLVSYRMLPKAILLGLQKPLRFSMRIETFRRPEDGMARLDELLDAGKIMGMQVNIFFLPCMPPDFRFWFNGHNLLVYGRDKANGDYLLFEPIFGQHARCSPDDLVKARFARGVFAPKGMLYYPTSAPQEPRWERAIPAALKKTARIMRAPLPFFGTRGIERCARAFERLPAATDPQATKLYIGHLIRMQEEIGTGGGGFRFMYAAFLEEAATRIARPVLAELAAQLVEIGDLWREFALVTAGMIRDRDPLDPGLLATLLRAQAAREKTFFISLDKAARLS